MRIHLLNFFAWLTGIIVSLAVGFAMFFETLTIPFIPAIIMKIAGVIVIITAFASIILVLFEK